MKYMLGIDIGTQSIRACLFDETGKNICAKTTEQYVRIDHPSWTSQDAGKWWPIVTESIRAVIRESSAQPADIVSVGCCAHMHGPVPVDKNGNLLSGDVQLYCDKRAAGIVEAMEAAAADQCYAITGNLPSTTWMGFKIKWLRENNPGLYEKTYRFLAPKDYINCCLTGEFYTDPTEASGTYAMDWQTGEWSDAALALMGIEKSKLPEIAGSFEVIGTVSAKAARETGLGTKTKVVCGSGDFLASMFASGLNESGLVIDSTATASTICCASGRPLFHRRLLELKNVSGGWTHYGVLDAAGAGFRWVRDTIAKAEAAQAEKTGVNLYDYLSGMAEKVPAGADGLVYLPYLLGERSAGTPDSRGVFFGLHLGSDVGQMVRAFLEGVAFDLKRTIDIFEDSGIAVKKIYHVSGGARGALWNQIKADIYGKPLYTLKADEGSVLGVALMGGVGAGIYESPERALGQVFAVDREYLPNPANRGLYEDLYAVFCNLHDMAQAPFARLKEIQDSTHRGVAET